MSNRDLPCCLILVRPKDTTERWRILVANHHFGAHKRHILLGHGPYRDVHRARCVLQLSLLPVLDSLSSTEQSLTDSSVDATLEVVSRLGLSHG